MRNLSRRKVAIARSATQHRRLAQVHRHDSTALRGCECACERQAADLCTSAPQESEALSKALTDLGLDVGDFADCKRRAVPLHACRRGLTRSVNRHIGVQSRFQGDLRCGPLGVHAPVGKALRHQHRRPSTLSRAPWSRRMARTDPQIW
jgi:hypothetical protein